MKTQYITQSKLDALDDIYNRALDFVDKVPQNNKGAIEVRAYFIGLAHEAEEIYPSGHLESLITTIKERIEAYLQGENAWELNTDSSGSIAYIFEPYDEFEIAPESWRYVFNTSLTTNWVNGITSAQCRARVLGYGFFSWNGHVYNVDGEQTGLLTTDLK